STVSGRLCARPAPLRRSGGRAATILRPRAANWPAGRAIAAGCGWVRSGADPTRSRLFMDAGGTNWRPMLALVAACVLLSACGANRVASPNVAAQANLNLGIGYLRQGRPDLAVENLQRALRIDPRLAAAHSALALAYDQLGNVDEAEEHHARAV